MRGKIILILVGLAALSVMFIYPPEADARRPFRQPTAMPWDIFWLMIFFRDSWGGGPTSFAKNKVLSGSIFGAGAVAFLVGILTVDIRLQLIGLPMAAYAAFAVLWLEYRKGVERKAKLQEPKVSSAFVEEIPIEEMGLAACLLSGSPELNLIMKESSYDDLVEDIVKPYISMLLAANPTPKRDALLKNIYAGVEQVMTRTDPEVKKVILHGLLLGKGSWWWNTSLPFMGEATQEALDSEVPMWRDLQVGTMPGCFPYADRFGIGERILN